MVRIPPTFAGPRNVGPVHNCVTFAPKCGTPMMARKKHLSTTPAAVGKKRLGTGDSWNGGKSFHRPHFLTQSVRATITQCPHPYATADKSTTVLSHPPNGFTEKTRHKTKGAGTNQPANCPYQSFFAFWGQLGQNDSRSHHRAALSSNSISSDLIDYEISCPPR